MRGDAGDGGHSFDDVETLLNGDVDGFEGELGELYDDMSYYAEVADALETADRVDDAEYFRELAVDAYDSFAYVIQLKKFEEDEDDPSVI